MLYSVLSRDTERERGQLCCIVFYLDTERERRGQLCCIVFYLGIQRERERSAVLYSVSRDRSASGYRERERSAVLYSVLSRDTEREGEVSCVV